MKLSAIKRTVLLFWALWLTVVTTTNVLDALVVLGALPDSLKFVSGNWKWINRTMDPLDVPRVHQALMFGGAIALEFLTAALSGAPSRLIAAVPCRRRRPRSMLATSTSHCGLFFRYSTKYLWHINPKRCTA